MRRGDDARRPIANGLRLPGDHVEAIDQSHGRCVALGVSRIERPDHSAVARPDLALARDRTRRLCDHAAPVMEMLYGQIVNSQSMVVLTDATGVIVHSIGDDDFLERASKVALKPGAVWSETAKGTNAIGTALVEEVPTLVHADEHYVHANHFLTCSAAPILDPRGNILGVLDVSGDRHGYHQHTMALVKMSARMIENGWLADDHRNVMRLHFHSRVAFIGTLMEGILAVAADGRIVGANRGALEQLGLSGAALRMHTLGTLLGTSVDALVDRFRSPLATPALVQGANGRTLHVLARFNWPVWTSLAEAVAGSPAPPAHVEPQEAAAVRRGGHSGHSGPSALAELCTGDAQVEAVVGKLRRVLGRGIAVLIVGDTGAGKESLARALHADSERSAQAFVAVNCAAASGAATAAATETAIAAELFGCAAGSLHGVQRPAAVGKIVRANGGTLFLNDVGDLPLPLQAQLLRVLQEGRLTPLGGQQAVPVDVALISATQRPLSEALAAKAFREDLYHRLNGLAVRLPPLRQRSDLAALVRRMLDQECPGQALQVAPEVMALLQHHPWPGNLRQLHNVLRVACAMAGADGPITRAHLADDFLEDALARLPHAAAAALEPAAPVAQRLDDMETAAIRQAVAAAGGNISVASRRLGISRNTIYRKLHWKRPAG